MRDIRKVEANNWSYVCQAVLTLGVFPSFYIMHGGQCHMLEDDTFKKCKLNHLFLVCASFMTDWQRQPQWAKTVC